MHVRQDELNISDAARILGINRTTIYHWCHDGVLKARRRDGHVFPLFAAVVAMRQRRERIARLKASAQARRAA